MTGSIDLPVLAPPPVARLSPERYAAFARRIRLLSWLSLGAMGSGCRSSAS